MNNKDQLQQELLEKVKPGVKASDLKKQKRKNMKSTEDEGYESDNKNGLKKIKELEKALIEANQKIRGQAIEIKNLNDNITWANTEIGDYKEKIKELQTKNQEKHKTIEELKTKGKDKEAPELFTCSQCQREWSKEFIRLVDKEENKTCVECVEKMLNLASQETGQAINLTTEEKEATQPTTKLCRFCRQEKSVKQIKERHIKNLSDGTDPREIVKICQDCLTYRAIKADYYCPRTSEGRDTYKGNEFDCYCERRNY